MIFYTWYTGKLRQLRSFGCLFGFGLVIVLNSYLSGKVVRYCLAFPAQNYNNASLHLLYCNYMELASSDNYRLLMRFCIRNHQHQNRHHNRSIFLDALLGAYSIFVLGNRIAKRNEDPRIPVDRREQNKKLAMTLFIVTSLSVLAWLPLTVSYIISYLVRIDQLRKLLHYTGRCLQLANSFVNPIVYYARMPEFRRTFKNLFRSVQISPEELQAHQHRVMQPEADIKFITSEVPRDSQN